MRVRVGVLTAGLVASVLAIGSPIAADDTTTSTPTTEATTTSEAPTTTVAPPTSETTTTVEPTTTEVATTVAPTTSIVEVGTPPTPPLVIGGAATPAAPSGGGNEQESATTLAEEITEVGPATPSGGSTPIRGTQVQTQPLPPPPTTTTTTTIPPPWALPANSGTGRRVVYSKSAQRVWVVDGNGEMIKTHLVSGRQTPLDPRPGTYSVWSRSRHTFSLANPTITWGFMVRFAKGGRGGNIGFHEIPFQYGRPVQSISQLGQALSGGCVRQARPDAVWMWNWAYLGTKVVVLG